MGGAQTRAAGAHVAAGHTSGAKLPCWVIRASRSGACTAVSFAARASWYDIFHRITVVFVAGQPACGRVERSLGRAVAAPNTAGVLLAHGFT